MSLISMSSFTTPEQIVAFMAEFGIVLTRHPPLPIKLAEFVEFLEEAQLPPAVLERVAAYIEKGQNLYNPADRPHARSHIWRMTLNELSKELFWAQPHKFIDRKTPIASMGSCFAVEIAYWLQENGFNYVITEPNPADEIQKASAQWGLLYASPNVKQVIEWAFGEDTPPIAVSPFGDNLPHGAVRSEVFADIFRESILYNRAGAMMVEEMWVEHLKCARAALEACEVLVITVGLNEVFRWLPTGHYTHRTPVRVNPGLWREEVLTVQQNVDFLTSAIATLRKYNPKVKIIATVSPVPLIKTFRRDTHVACATAYSKAVLRVALEELSRSVSDFYYMASFETVMYPGTGLKVWQDDSRHVESEIIGKIMRLFQTQFCVDESEA